MRQAIVEYAARFGMTASWPAPYILKLANDDTFVELVITDRDWVQPEGHFERLIGEARKALGA